MAKKRISHEAMAAIGIAGGLVALAAVGSVRVVPGAGAEEPTALVQAIAILGFAAWFVGAGASVLTLSTRLSRWGVVGLVICGIAAAAFVLPSVLG